ncbi:MAG: excinuclease ABC subunit UvrA [Candidatus Moraniibacteriota bacterium]
MEEKIIIRGAKTHNLKNINVEIPRNKMVVFTGLSGSGKSSLAFDTIFAEGQRRYVESLSTYARQFLRQMQKPDVEEISGLSPAISIDQKSRSGNPRSTVATITEIYDYLRVLFARVGKPYCLECGREIRKLTQEEIQETIINVIKKFNDKKSAKKLLGIEYNDLKIKIFAPVVMGRKGEYYQLLYNLLNKGYEKVKVDGELKSLRERIILEKNKRHDIDLLIDEIYVTDLQYSEKDTRDRISEALEASLGEAKGLVKIEQPNGKEKIISAEFMCPYDGFSFPEIEPRLFSFNSPYGACPACNGLGTKGFFSKRVCPVCQGARLRPEALNVFIKQKGEDSGKNIVEVSNMSIKDAYNFFNSLDLSEKDKEISKNVVKEIIGRLKFMKDVGIEYLTLSRKAGTLSGGESQRIRLASQLGSGLVGALYVLDEPTIGLHKRDNDRLLTTLLNLRDLGNTIIAVEHDEDTIFASDYIVDLGPGAGVHGGEVVVADDLAKLIEAPKNNFGSLTLDYLRGEKKIKLPERRRTAGKGEIKIRGGKVFNIKNMNVDVPLGKLIGLTGVSGSGKSSFMYEILHKNLYTKNFRHNKKFEPINCSRFEGDEDIYRTIMIDQTPIGRTPRSNPATYTGAFTHIRDLFASTKEAKARGWKPGRFSFNVKGGRCEACGGNGMVSVEMHFLPTVYVECDVCKGKRFMKETLEVKYKGKNIYEVLKMTIEEATIFFQDIPAIYDRLKTLQDVGLGYLELGQSATTLSGGEAQRVKIASELYRPQTKKTFYFLDEPTVGLHYDDVRKLIEIVQKLVDRGNSVMVLEHNLELIKCADYIIDIGPEGGDEGGKVVAAGTPEEIVEQRNKSYTGKYLKNYLR